MASTLTIIPKVTIHPSKICLYSELHWDGGARHSCDEITDKSDLSEVNTSFLHSSRKNNGFLSDNAKRSLFKAIDYLLITSDRKRVFSKVQNKYITFRVVFATFTLPSAQLHTDKEITSRCWNQLLIELAKYHNVHKYVWRAEKQENGDIHYHLLINEFIEWSELRKRWNRICNKLGYVDSYQARQKEFFKNGFKLSDNKNDKRSIDQQRKAYIIGQKSDWTSPNSTDIHDVRKVKDIKRYIGKYMAKQPEISLDEIKADSELNVVNGRLWSCSQNLSNLKGCQLVEDWQVSDELYQIAEKSKCYVYRSTHFQVLCISIDEVAKHGSGLLLGYFSDYLIETFDYHLNLKIAV